MARPLLPDPAASIRRLVRAEQLREHYAQIPAMAIAPTVGGFFTAWVLWGAVDNRYLAIGVGVVSVLSVLRLVLYGVYFRRASAHADAAHWHVLAVAGALVSGCVWGSAAPFLYPPQLPNYTVFLVVLLTMLPVVPVAALAAYMPAFYAYYLPCLMPFIVTLTLRDSRAEHMAAGLLVMMLVAMLTFARRYSSSLAQAISLRLQLARQSDALQAAMAHKSRFIAAASHDLRQPVHAMGLFLASLRQRGGAAAEARVIDHLEASQRSLRDMLTNMLDISRLDAAVARPRPRDVAVAPLLRRLAAEFAPSAAARQLDFRVRVVDGLVRSDPALLERIVRNLLSNALKYTRRGGILLACRPRGAAWRIQVIDTGIGIAESNLATIFREYNQLGGGAGQEAESLGLGLAIVDQIARLLGHAVQVRSRPGRGSMFAVVLEPGRRHAADQPEASAPAAGEADPPLSVMIIDDDAAVRAATAQLVGQWGHRTSVWASAVQALDGLTAGADVPDVLIVDLRLAGGHSGLDAAALVRRQLMRALPVILVTGDTAPERIRQAYEAGHFLLHKPVDPQRLRACIAEAGAVSEAARS